ncbi:MAG: cation:proton antiporter [Alphaproteobacteria bacterium]
MEDLWFASAVWIGLALLASIISIKLATSVVLVEIVMGAIAGNFIGLEPTPWVDFLAGFGAVLIIFLAGTEVDHTLVRSRIGRYAGLGVASFLVPCLGTAAVARYALAWSWPASEIAGLALSETSVAIVYTVLIEGRISRTEIGQTILAASFVTNLCMILMLGVLFSRFDGTLAALGAATAFAMWAVPRLARWSAPRLARSISDPQFRFLALILLALGGLAGLAHSEAVLPAYLLGLALSPVFATDRELNLRVRAIAFGLLTPFFFLKAGALLDVRALGTAVPLVLAFAALKVALKAAGVVPVAALYGTTGRERGFLALMLSTGLTFGNVVLLFGLANHHIDGAQYAALLSAIILTGLVPTVLAQRLFRPASTELRETP